MNVMKIEEKGEGFVEGRGGEEREGLVEGGWGMQ